MKSTGDADRDRARKYHIRRAQTRKALTTPLSVEWERMPSDALWIHLIRHLETLVTTLGDGTDRDSVYSSRFALGAALELHDRDAQQILDLLMGLKQPARGYRPLGPYSEED